MPNMDQKQPDRILVVDDDPHVLRFVDRVLRGAGYATHTAPGGPDALRIADSAGPFDLLLTDVRMPEMTGDELARRMRMRQPDVRVLYLTGFNEQLFADKRVLWEGEAYLDKPTTIEGLLEAVSLLLHGRLKTATL
jgi:two-component system cell cycle sensor histidine kinase/response regulator CckA